MGSATRLAGTASTTAARTTPAAVGRADGSTGARSRPRAGYRCAACTARVVYRTDPRRRIGSPPPGPSQARLAARDLQGHVRADQPRPVPRRAPPGRAGGQDQVPAARPLQDRRAGQGRRRQDHRRRRRRVDLRRDPPGGPGGGHRRRHRLRQTGQPHRPECRRLVLGAGRRPAPLHLRRRRARVGNNAAGLFVLAGEATTARRRVLDPAIYREATARLDHHFTISVVDCGSTMDSPVTQEALRDLDALIVVSSPWVDGASAAGQTMEWLANRGFTGLLHRTVVVLNDSDGHADKRTRAMLAQQFGQPRAEGRRGAVRHAPAARRSDRREQRDRRPPGAGSSRSRRRSPSTSRLAGRPKPGERPTVRPGRTQ